MAMATGYHLDEYKRFVGSLRKTGYLGHIILAVAPTIDEECTRYLSQKGVTVRKVQYVNCTKPILTASEVKDSHQKELTTCVHPYPSLKNRWGRFPLLRDYLMECTDCTGPVLVTDMRDTIFQRDPFGPDAPPVDAVNLPLQLFEEHYTIRTTNWLVEWPVRECKGVTFDRPMLCSGTTIGTRVAVLEYLNVMHNEMMEWMADPKCCCFGTNGDDQSIHNYLFYHRDQLAHLAPHAVPNRMGLVHTVGAHGAMIHSTHVSEKHDAWDLPFDGINTTTKHSQVNGRWRRSWIGMQFGLTDNEGYFVDYNGERSFIVHQYDRLGNNYGRWIEENKDVLYE